MESMVVFYPCLDIEKTNEFYQKVIGLTLYQDQGSCKIFDTGYGYLGFCEYEDHILATKTCISFNLPTTKDVDVKYQEMKAQNIVGLTAPKKHPKFDVYSFFMKDPNDYTIEFQKILNHH